jgi:hypothetical protein
MPFQAGVGMNPAAFVVSLPAQIAFAHGSTQRVPCANARKNTVAAPPGMLLPYPEENMSGPLFRMCREISPAAFPVFICFVLWNWTGFRSGAMRKLEKAKTDHLEPPEMKSGRQFFEILQGSAQRSKSPRLYSIHLPNRNKEHDQSAFLR